MGSVGRFKLAITTKLRSVEPWVLAVFGLASAAGFIFLQLADEVLEGENMAFDKNILLSLRQPGNLSVQIGPSWLTHVVADITSLGGTTVLTLITMLTFFYLLILRQKALGVFVLLSVVGGWMLSTLLKIVIARPRPEIVPHLIDVHDLSFPSGHAMLSAVTYLTLGALLSRLQGQRIARIYLMAVAVFLTFLIGLSRIYLGVHYPTDVLGGWSAGAFWAILCWMVARRWVLPAGNT